jgi:endoglucanase
MQRQTLLTWVALLTTSLTFANISIFKAGATLVTDTWASPTPSAISVVTNDSPYEGTNHYKFTYTTNNTWAGFGLNMDNWGGSAAKNFSGYTHFKMAFRGLTSGDVLYVKLRNGNTFSTPISIGGNVGAYTIVEINMNSLLTNGLVATAIREIDFDVISPQATSTGTVYIDALELVNIAPPAPIASATCLARAASMGKGFNTSNWLEAYWLQPFNTYPVVNDYTRARFKALAEAGFKHVRLPIIFERITPNSSPYTLNTNQVAYHLIDSAIIWANTFNLKLIIDNHHGYDPNDTNYATEIPRKCAIWKQIVQRYANIDPNRFFFEIYNEPNGISNNNWRVVAKAIMDTVRQYNTGHTFIIGGNGWNSMSGLTSFQPLTDTNVIYTFHTYDPYNFTHQGMSWTSTPYLPARTFPLNNELNDLRTQFRAVKSWGAYYGVPVYMGEFGVGTSADATSRCNWVNHITHLADSLAIPWAYWDTKNYNDAFGFYPNSLMTEANAIPCFKSAMGLYQATVAVEDIQYLGAKCHGNNIDIQWISELLPNHVGVYQIEGSTDGKTWEVLSQAQAKSGKHRYKESISLNESGHYFRVVYIEPDGNLTASAVINASCKDKNAIAVYPNPVSDGHLTLNYSFAKPKSAKLYVINSSGQIVEQMDILANEANNLLQLDVSQFPKGVYYIRLWSEDNDVMSTKFTVF